MTGQRRALRFERVRNFGRIMADTRNFVRENFVVFFKTILFLGGPFILLTCALETWYQVSHQFATQNMLMGNRFGSYIAFTRIIHEARWVLNGFLVAIIVSHFIKVYREKGPGHFDTGDVGKSIRKDFFGTLLSFLVLFAVVAGISLILGYLAYGLSGASLGGIVALTMLAGIAYFMLRFPFWYYVYCALFARTSTEKPMNIFSALSLSGRVFAGNWWNTWIICVCMWLILFGLGFVVSLSFEFIKMMATIFSVKVDEASADWKWVGIIFGTLSEFAKTIINSVFCVTIALQFYSLREKQTGDGTKKVIDSIGTKNEDEDVEYTW